MDIEVDMIGGYEGGTAYINVTAEQDPDTSPVKVWCAIIEDHEIASSAWGGYNGKEMMWIPVAFPLGYDGQTIEFTGPYPQTIEIEGSYTLNPAIHPYENLNVVTFVQGTVGLKEVFNADYINLAATTGFEGGETGNPDAVSLSAGPNPTTGPVTIGCQLPSDVTGTVQVFDITGRVVETFPAEGTIHTEIEKSGVYFVHLNTSSGELVRRRLTIIR